MLDCVPGQTSDLDSSLLVFSKPERILSTNVFKQIIDLFIVNLEERTLRYNLMTILFYLLEDIEKHPRYEATLLGLIDLLQYSEFMQIYLRCLFDNLNFFLDFRI